MQPLSDGFLIIMQMDSKTPPAELISVEEYLSRRASVIGSRSAYDFGTDPFPHLGLSAVNTEAATTTTAAAATLPLSASSAAGADAMEAGPAPAAETAAMTTESV